MWLNQMYFSSLRLCLCARLHYFFCSWKLEGKQRTFCKASVQQELHTGFTFCILRPFGCHYMPFTHVQKRAINLWLLKLGVIGNNVMKYIDFHIWPCFCLQGMKKIYHFIKCSLLECSVLRVTLKKASLAFLLPLGVYSKQLRMSILIPKDWNDVGRIPDTVMILSFRTDMPGQTVQTQIRLLLEEQSDQGLHCLPVRLHRLASLLYGRAT